MQYKKLYKQTNKNGEIAGHVQIKLPWIPEALGCSLVVEHITVGRSFSQLFEVEPKDCVIKMRTSCQDLTNHRISESGYSLLIGYIKQLDASRNQRPPLPVFLGASGIQGSNQV